MTRVKIFIFLLGLTAVGLLLGIYNPWVKGPSWEYFSVVLFVQTVPTPHPTTVITTKSTTTKNPRSCSCEKCLTDDPVLRKHRLDTFVQPLLSANYKLSEDDWKWWVRRQGEKTSFSDYETAVERMFQLIPPEPDVAEPNSDKCRSCAVVGNSPNLLGSNYGEIIDSKNIVIRINNGRVKGFEKDVGTKTTHRAMYPVSAENLDNTTHLLYYGFKWSDLQYLMDATSTGYKGKSKLRPTFTVNKQLAMVLNPAFMKYVHYQWLGQKGNYPSTGMLTVVLALFICDEVDVLGFGADKRGRWTHYWDKPEPNGKDVHGNHPRSTEHDVLEQLHKDGRIKFHKGN